MLFPHKTRFLVLWFKGFGNNTRFVRSGFLSKVYEVFLYIKG